MQTLADEKRDREFRERIWRIPERLGDLPASFLIGTVGSALLFIAAAVILYRML
jgi:hypothetical protein